MLIGKLFWVVANLIEEVCVSQCLDSDPEEKAYEESASLFHNKNREEKQKITLQKSEGSGSTVRWRIDLIQHGEQIILIFID